MGEREVKRTREQRGDFERKIYIVKKEKMRKGSG